MAQRVGGGVGHVAKTDGSAEVHGPIEKRIVSAEAAEAINISTNARSMPVVWELSSGVPKVTVLGSGEEGLLAGVVEEEYNNYKDIAVGEIVNVTVFGVVELEGDFAAEQAAVLGQPLVYQAATGEVQGVASAPSDGTFAVLTALESEAAANNTKIKVLVRAQ